MGPAARPVMGTVKKLRRFGRDELRLVLDTNASRQAEAKLGPTKVSFSDGCRRGPKRDY
jgi:hypothetical protein